MSSSSAKPRDGGGGKRLPTGVGDVGYNDALFSWSCDVMSAPGVWLRGGNESGLVTYRETKKHIVPNLTRYILYFTVYMNLHVIF